MKPADLYKMRPSYVRKSDGDEYFPTCYLERHLTGVNFYDLPDEFNLEGIEYKWYADECFDGRRGWELLSVWYKDRPFMIIRQAGRENRDFRDCIVTDLVVYRELQKYIQSLAVVTEEDVPVHDPETDFEDLDCFYSNCLSSFYRPEGVNPQYKEGDILLVRYPKNHLLGHRPENMHETRIVVQAVDPYHPEHTYRGKQLDRASATIDGKHIYVDVEPGKGTIGAHFSDKEVVRLLERSESTPEPTPEPTN